MLLACTETRPEASSVASGEAKDVAANPQPDGPSDDARPPAIFEPGRLPICDRPNESPLGFVCDLGRDAAQVDLGCESPRVVKACRALVPSFSGHTCSPPPEEGILTFGYVPWQAGLLTEQRYEGRVAAIGKQWRIADEGEAASRWEDDRRQLLSWGCESVNLIEGKREHFLCGPDWEARFVHALGYFSVEVGTTAYFDCRYAGMNGEASRPSRTDW